MLMDDFIYFLLSHKQFFFVDFSLSKKFFLRKQEIFDVFYVFWTKAIILRKVVRRLADKTLTYRISILNNF